MGGVLSEAYNWRATFVLLAVMTVPLSLWAVYVLPETHHYFVVQRVAVENEKHLENNSGTETINKQEAVPATKDVSSFQIVPTTEVSDEIDLEAPAVDRTAKGALQLVEAEGMVRERMVMPWESLMFLVDRQLAPSYAMICATFAV